MCFAVLALQSPSPLLIGLCAIAHHCHCHCWTPRLAIPQALRLQQQQLYGRTRPGCAPPRFEWCLLVDNSGSMASKAQGAKMAVVLLMEVLRRLENPFAVVTFGRKQRVGVLGCVTR